jgi:PAS domain S-box-containing protein
MTLPDGRIHVNRALADMLGYCLEELDEKTWQDITPTEDIDLTWRTLRPVLDGVSDSARFDKRYLHKNGSFVWADVSATVKRDANGNPEYFMTTVVDITERKRAEEAVNQLNAELEQRVKARTKELRDSQLALLNVVDDLNQKSKDLEAAVEQLAAANKELEAFSYSVSHDLRAPLRAVDGYVQILLEDYGSLLDDEGKRVCAVISQSARNMGRLIDDLLAFARIGRQAMQFSALDMKGIVYEAFYQLTTPESRARIDFRLGNLPSTTGDLSLIRQVWSNLLDNAIKFSSGKRHAVIEVDGKQQSNEIVYSVRDNGAGFDMKYADKLFGVFQRLHGASEFAGTGVGLAIIQRIVQRHGGRIWAEGETDKGATFYFTLQKGVIDGEASARIDR